MSSVEVTSRADILSSARRERRREQSRDRMYTAAVELFTERGYKATTMDAIAERADVARATVFNYFPEKVAFLAEWGRRRRIHVAEVVTGSSDPRRGAGSAVRSYLLEMAALNIASRAQTTVLMDASARHGALLADRALAQALAGHLERGCRDGEFRDDTVTDEVAALLSNVYFTAVLQWIAEPEPFDLRGRIDSLVSVVLRGIAA